ncbi:hypothetical protein COW99_05155 [Candidatus Roizmanbacteria bacterium CG22_combo_CG10-13_8_21_14_all_38_20]|uniref:SpoVT-AbrB domain-containing protein n=1 Tax=Candidatus Roizmanbacteria bacterium CG22_combo_CG10-13_8_21_14_all_38_20 TaxID=1974862 RepID=A0A2H0BU13_9BACT|nr:AbrB/MazE/SpoVT family DNA-binding domain-containing protein [Candidatus Microgenomates bacterium]PIP61152.1 MAG: hypothetical protein COW99_05155 [Candidatus Roizmanbacteria bacterium CG22_combo_CG10-13_8_21_14_all_38_20]PJC31142.1 MAG: hypothetical protein CO050_03820 [Candidatus Roizmanbacteria bacterium CG_4_9_14_0_2_um_filter_38_17]
MTVQQQLTFHKISAKGQIVIPSLIRKKFGWESGMKAFVKSAHPTEVVFSIKPAVPNLGYKYKGSLKDELPSLKLYLKDKKVDIAKE